MDIQQLYSAEGLGTARTGLAGTALARRGEARHGYNALIQQGPEWFGLESHGPARHGGERNGAAWIYSTYTTWRGQAGLGSAWRRLARLGLVWLGTAWN
jgi:hypothetical protein